MTIRIEIGDMTVTCETVDEAGALISVLKGQPMSTGTAVPQRSTAPVSSVTPTSALAGLWSAIDDESRDFLSRIAQFPDGIIAEKLAEDTDKAVGEIGWIRRRLKTKAKKLGIDLDDLVIPGKVPGDDEKPKTAYTPSQQLQREIAGLRQTAA